MYPSCYHNLHKSLNNYIWHELVQFVIKHQSWVEDTPTVFVQPITIQRVKDEGIQTSNGQEPQKEPG